MIPSKIHLAKLPDLTEEKNTSSTEYRFKKGDSAFAAVQKSGCYCSPCGYLCMLGTPDMVDVHRCNRLWDRSKILC